MILFKKGIVNSISFSYFCGMDKINEDFNWVIKVLNSCETLTQVRRTEKVFENFKNLHKEHFKSLGKKDETKKTFKENFKKSLREKISTLEKL